MDSKGWLGTRNSSEEKDTDLLDVRSMDELEDKLGKPCQEDLIKTFHNENSWGKNLKILVSESYQRLTNFVP